MERKTQRDSERDVRTPRNRKRSGPSPPAPAGAGVLLLHPPSTPSSHPSTPQGPHFRACSPAWTGVPKSASLIPRSPRSLLCGHQEPRLHQPLGARPSAPSASWVQPRPLGLCGSPSRKTSGLSQQHQTLALLLPPHLPHASHLDPPLILSLSLASPSAPDVSRQGQPHLRM